MSDGYRSMKGTPYWMAPEVIKQTGHGRYGTNERNVLTQTFEGGRGRFIYLSHKSLFCTPHSHSMHPLVCVDFGIIINQFLGACHHYPLIHQRLHEWMEG